MENNILVSVVIPTHNREILLKRAINSVINQSYTNLEIIIVSDGSTDNTKSTVENYMNFDSRVKFIDYYPAKGGNVARNIGIKNTTGEYTAFLDDDDEWDKDKIKKQLELINNDKAIGLVYTWANIIFEKENVSYKSRSDKEGDLSKIILLENCIGTTSSVLVSSKILKEVGMFDENLPALQDFELWIRITQKTKVGVIKETLINYYNELKRKQISSSTQKYIDALLYINKKHANLTAHLTDQEIREKNINEFFLLGNKAMRNGNPKLGRRYMVKILKEKFVLKAFLYYLLSFLGYKFVIKLRKFI